MKKITTLLLIILSLATFCQAQNFVYEYDIVRLDSTLDNQVDPKLQKYVAGQKAKMEKEMSVVIGRCAETMHGFSPASPLSNFLTDMLLNNAATYTADTAITRCDLAILNFGGIRTSLPAGDITVGDIFQISPFNNTVVIIDIRGSELRKVINRFTERDCAAAFAGAQITFLSGRPYKIQIQGEPLDNDKIYRLATIDFIAGGGDKILSDIEFIRTTSTETIYRDFIINAIKKMSQNGQPIQGNMDDRVIILPQP